MCFFTKGEYYMTKKTKNIKKWIIFGLTICLLPVFVNWVMTIPCNWTCNGPQVWIGFWGAYLGAIASFAMAYIAWEQIQILNEQNRPYLYPTIEIVPYRNNGSNHFDYCLHIANHGSRIASDVHVEIDGEVLNSKENKYLEDLSVIRDQVYNIPEKDDIFLRICPELSVETVKDEDYALWLDKFKQSSVRVKLCYNNEYAIKKTISLSDSLFAKTTSLQMLYYLKQSIDNLNETLKTGTNKGDEIEKCNFASE